jgi:hypothetical protein
MINGWHAKWLCCLYLMLMCYCSKLVVIHIVTTLEAQHCSICKVNSWNDINYSYLTFNRWMGQSSPIKCIFFSSKRENIILKWALKLNGALATAETWHLRGCVLKAKCLMDFTTALFLSFWADHCSACVWYVLCKKLLHDYYQRQV